MSNSACQACHREQYRSFAADHPGFEGWPETRRTRIAFDHAAHQSKHFPAEKQEFDCRQCHQIAGDGFEATLGFRKSCANCHESDIQVSLNSGIAFISLPMIDTEALAESGHKIGRWPDGAAGDFDGALPILSKFLVMSDDETAKSLDKLGTDFDFFDVDPADVGQLASAAQIVAELTALADELAEKGHDAIRKRVEKLVARELTPAELQAAAAHLSSEYMSAPSSRWLAGEENPRDSSRELVTAGAWVRDDETYTLRYLPAGHDDLFLAAWIDLLASATRGPQPKLAEELLKDMMKPTAPGMCGSCHSVDHDPHGGFAVNWLAKQPSSERDFTFFSHRPHVLQSELADCKACHRFVDDANVMSTYAQTNPNEFDAGFHVLTRQQCATCHKPGAAGDSCTQCHRYHVTALQEP